MSEFMITPDPAAVINVGKVTSYADAVAGGYQGTREEWKIVLANLGTTAAEVEANRQAVAEDKAAVEGDVTTVEEYKDVSSSAAAAALQSAESAHTDALAATAAKEAAQTAQGIAEEARADAVSAKGAAESAQTDANASASAATEAALAAGNAAQTATANAGAAADSATAAAASAASVSGVVQEVTAAKTEAITAIETKGAETLDSIPDDYTELSGNVADLKSAIKDVSGGAENMAYFNRLLWENGGINTITGANLPSATARARTSYITRRDVDYIDNSAPLVSGGETWQYHFRILAYNGDTYVGCWDGAGNFVQSATGVDYVDRFDFGSYPYNFKIMVEAYKMSGDEKTFLDHPEMPLRDTPVFYKNAKNHIGILFIGNSLTQDSIAYLPLLMRRFLPDTLFDITLLHYGGQTLAQIYNHILANDQSSMSFVTNSDRWINTGGRPGNAVPLYNYDIVCMQGYYNYNTESEVEAYNNIRDWLISNNALKNTGRPLKFMTLIHAPKRDDAETIYTRTVTDCGTILKDTICDDILPTGTAIYLATKTDLNALGDNGGLSNDGTHAQEGLPVLIENYVTLMWIADYLHTNIQIYGSDYRFTTEDYNAINPPGPHLGTGVITGTDAENLLGQECAIQAYKFGRKFRMDNLA